jgi:predicted nucleic acid-binding protein
MDMLIDSDVLIWVARGNASAISRLETVANWHISAVSYMELAQGCRDKAELKAMQKAFSFEAGDVLAITQPISDLACTLVEKYALSHSLHLADALIAATAMINAMPLLTGNGKRFSAIKGLKIEVFKPVALP